MRLDRIGIEADLAAAAERHARRRRDHRERAVLELAVDLLALGDQVLDHRPDRDVGREQREPDVGADREVAALVVDHERLEVLGDDADRLVDQVERVAVERVHLAVELEAGDAVADVPEAGGAVLRHRPAPPLDVLEQQHALGPDDVGVVAGQRQMLQATVLDPVERPVPDFAQQRRHRQAVRLEPLGEPGRADPVEQLERAPFPVVAEPHRLIDRGDVVGDLGHQRGGVGERPAHHPPGVARGRLVGLEQRPRAAVLGGIDRIEARPGGGVIVAGLEVDRLLDPLAVRPGSGGRSRPCPCGRCSRSRSAS